MLTTEVVPLLGADTPGVLPIPASIATVNVVPVTVMSTGPVAAGRKQWFQLVSISSTDAVVSSRVDCHTRRRHGVDHGADRR